MKSQTHFDMNSEKYINGEGAPDNEELTDGQAGNADFDEGDAGDSSAGRVPETIDDELEDDGEVEDYNISDVEFDTAEFSDLNSALDELQGALDTLESRNDGIHEQLLQLLQSNREMRSSLLEEIIQSNAEDDAAIASANGAAADEILAQLSAKLELGEHPLPPVAIAVNEDLDSTSACSTSISNSNNTETFHVSHSES